MVVLQIHLMVVPPVISTGAPMEKTRPLIDEDTGQVDLVSSGSGRPCEFWTSGYFW